MNELYHYGILGMKWGVRRTSEQLGHRRSSYEEEKRNRFMRSSGSRSSETLYKARGENIDELTNQQLQDYNNRLNLERNFAQLTEGNVKSAKDWVMKTLVTGVVVGALTAIARDQVTKWLKKKFGIDNGK